MKRRVRWCVIVLPVLFLSACAVATPASRLESYVGSSVTRPAGSSEACRQRDVGLMVIHDTAAQGTVAPFSQEGLQHLSERIKVRVEQSLPVKIVKVAAPRSLAGQSEWFSWQQTAREQDVDVLLLVVLSLVEAKSQDRLPLDGSQDGGGAMGMLVGSTTSDYALVEMGLLDAKADLVLARAEGRGVATLEQLDSGLTSNAYPVIRQPGRAQRYFPPRGEGNAQGMTALIAVDDALEQALYRLKSCSNQ